MTDNFQIRAERNALAKWIVDEFYAPHTVVLGIDMGIEGIGIAIRKGQELIYCKTLLMELPEAAHLAQRRQYRAARHARKNRRVRMRRLRELFARHHLPWVDDDVCSRSDPILLRHRAIAGERPLASREALSLCIRSCVERRGYDYYALTGRTDEGFPWGAEPKLSEAKNWLKSAYVDDTLRKQLHEYAPLLLSRNQELTEEERNAWDSLVEAQAANAVMFSIPARLKEYASHGVQTNERRWKGNNFPRAHVKEHLRTILERHKHLIEDYEAFCEALFLPCDTPKRKKKVIFHYNRKTPEEAKRHYQKRVKRCPYCSWLGLDEQPCGTRGDKDIRQWNVVDFASNRTFEWEKDKLPQGRLLMPEAGVQALLEAIKSEAQHWEDAKKAWEKAVLPYKLAKKSDWNKTQLEQLKELVIPGRNASKRAGISAQAARELLDRVSFGRTCYTPASIEAAKKEIGLYEKRKAIQEDTGIYPQVQLLIGTLRKSQKQRETKGEFAVTGLLQRLFQSPELKEKLDGKTIPDYCVIECVRHAPATKEAKAEIEEKQHENRERRDKQAQRYGKNAPTHAEFLRMKLFEEQGGSAANEQKGAPASPARCPFTGEELGTDPFSRDLELAHLFPDSRGGFYIADNLVLTRRSTNAAMGNRTPQEAAAASLPGWLSWEEMQNHSKLFHWGQTKRYLFAFSSDQEHRFPDFEEAGLTRPAQLAIALRGLVARWMGIHHDSEEMRKRIGSPSGFYTAAARRGMLWEGYNKDRAHHLHHRMDAAVMTCIPPGEGLNDARYGGIFLTQSPTESNRKLTTLKGLPLLDFKKEWEHPDGNPIIQQRGNIKTTSLGGSSFWRVNEQGMTSQRIPLNLSEKKKGEKKVSKKSSTPTASELYQILKRMGISNDKIPSEKKLENLVSPPPVQGEETTTKAISLKLKNGAPVRNIWEFGSEGNLDHSPLGWSGLLTEKGKFYQMRKLKPVNERLEIWLGWDSRKKRWKYFKRIIPTARTLEGLKRLGMPWRGREGAPAWLITLLNKEKAKDLKTLTCRTLPPYAVRVGFFRKEDHFQIEFKKENEDTEKPTKSENTAKLTCRISAVGIDKRARNEYLVFKELFRKKGKRRTIKDTVTLAQLLHLPAPEILAQEKHLTPPA